MSSVIKVDLGIIVKGGMINHENAQGKEKHTNHHHKSTNNEYRQMGIFLQPVDFMEKRVDFKEEGKERERKKRRGYGKK